jgi:hypothetical protein
MLSFIPVGSALPMPDHLVEANLGGHIQAINLCLENHLRIPALVLIYTGMDVMANLSRPQEKEQANRRDFEIWAETYMDCMARFGVSGLDLYAARCAIVHSYTFDSALSRNRMARRIIYAWGNKKVEGPNAVLAHVGFREKMIKIEDLFLAFATGIDTFRRRLDEGSDFSKMVQSRARQFFADLPTFPSVEDPQR